MVSKKTTPVAVVMGSDSDMAIMQSCIETLSEFGIEPEVRILSAHRTPQLAAEFADNAAKEGIKVIIAAAGMAAHLAGAVAARTTLPVIAVPLISASGLDGIDAPFPPPPPQQGFPASHPFSLHLKGPPRHLSGAWWREG